MSDNEKTKEQLNQDISELRARCAKLEISAFECRRLEFEIQEVHDYFENIFETVREPLLVLDSSLKILSANSSFHKTFKLLNDELIGCYIYDIGNWQWDIPELRVLLEDILPNNTEFSDFKVEHDFVGVGHKLILLNARQILRNNVGSHIILLAMEDITERTRLEMEREEEYGRIKNLEGIISICIFCKKIRGDTTSWNRMEKYITDHSEARFSHGMCPSCAEEQIKKLWEN